MLKYIKNKLYSTKIKIDTTRILRLKNILRVFKKKTSPYITNHTYDIVIHIGAPKTGSSAIQKFLLENKYDLAKAGIYYPIHRMDQNGISGGHSGLGLSLINGQTQKAKEIFEDYIKEAQNNNMTLLLSAESFFNHHDKLAKLVQGYRCKVIAFFRDPFEALFSNYNQSIKRHFNTTHITHVCKKALLSTSDGNVGKYAQWIDTFGKENVTILEYDKEYFAKESIQEVFLEHTGLDKPTIDQIKPKKTEQVNKSYLVPELEFKRLLNYVLDKDNKKENFEIDWQLQKLSDQRKDTHSLVDELSSDLYAQLQSKYDNARNNLVEHGMVSLQRNKAAKKQHHHSKYPYKDKINDILKIVEYFKLEHPKLYSYMCDKITKHIQNKTSITCDEARLAEWFNIVTQINSNINELMFSQEQFDKMANGKYKEADFLRDIAKLLFCKGELTNAKKLATKALELRPKGPAIIKLNQAISQQMEQS